MRAAVGPVVVTVSIAEAGVLPGVTELGFREQEMPTFAGPEQLRLTVLLKPFCPLTDRV